MVNIPNDSSNREMQDTFNQQVDNALEDGNKKQLRLEEVIKVALDEPDYASFVIKLKATL